MALTKTQKKILFYCEKYGIDKFKDFSSFSLENLSSSYAQEIYSFRNDEDKFILSLQQHYILSYIRTSSQSKLKNLSRRQNDFRTRKKENYSLTQIYLENDLKKNFKEYCLKNNISMEVAFNGLLRSFLV